MDFSAELDRLQQHLSDARAAAQTAATQSREKLDQQVDKAQSEIDAAARDATGRV
jgi:hypothetical protein